VIERDRLVHRALILSVLSIVINGLAGGSAVVVGLTSGSLSLLGFGFDAAIDSAASVALVWRFMIEKREPHRAERVEQVAEAIVGAVLIVLAAYLGVNAVRALLTNAHPEATAVGTGLLIFSVLALPPLAIAKFRAARSLGSGALRADSVLTGVAALLALISLVGVGLTLAFGLAWTDAVGAMIVTVVLVREGIGSLQVMRSADTA
jgi:divalent metal cation (Fe/Co/Zn/Cd) transporter